LKSEENYKNKNQGKKMDKIYNVAAPVVAKIPVVFTARGAVVATFLLIFVAKTCQVQMHYILTPKKGYNNVNPRILENDQSWQSKAIARARSAQDNSWEAFIGFTAAMLMALTANHTVVDPIELQQLANAFVFVRLAYIVTYIFAFNAPLSGIRSAIWLVGLGIILKIFAISCGNIMV
jgi:uncharacterized MAPEG superfamily protein